jgi:hypothetical protein
MGIEPSVATQKLFETIRDGHLGPGDKSTGWSEDIETSRGGDTRQPFTLSGQQPNSKIERRSPTRFVGREDELAILGKHLSSVLAGPGRVAF